jgi:hypothetical protein
MDPKEIRFRVKDWTHQAEVRTGGGLLRHGSDCSGCINNGNVLD